MIKIKYRYKNSPNEREKVFDNEYQYLQWKKMFSPFMQYYERIKLKRDFYPSFSGKYV